MRMIGLTLDERVFHNIFKAFVATCLKAGQGCGLLVRLFTNPMLILPVLQNGKI